MLHLIYDGCKYIFSLHESELTYLKSTLYLIGDSSSDGVCALFPDLTEATLILPVARRGRVPRPIFIIYRDGERRLCPSFLLTQLCQVSHIIFTFLVRLFLVIISHIAFIVSSIMSHLCLLG